MGCRSARVCPHDGALASLAPSSCRRPLSRCAFGVFVVLFSSTLPSKLARTGRDFAYFTLGAQSSWRSLHACDWLVYFRLELNIAASKQLSALFLFSSKDKDSRRDETELTVPHRYYHTSGATTVMRADDW